MKFRTGTRVPGSNQTVDLELEDSDMSDLPDWDTYPLSKKWQVMTVRGDSLIVEYLFRNEHISKEFAQQRMAEIKGGATS